MADTDDTDTKRVTIRLTRRQYASIEKLVDRGVALSSSGFIRRAIANEVARWTLDTYEKPNRGPDFVAEGARLPIHPATAPENTDDGESEDED